MQDLIIFNNNNKIIFQLICCPEHTGASGQFHTQYFLIYLKMLKSY